MREESILEKTTAGLLSGLLIFSMFYCFGLLDSEGATTQQTTHPIVVPVAPDMYAYVMFEGDSRYLIIGTTVYNATNDSLERLAKLWCHKHGRKFRHFGRMSVFDTNKSVIETLVSYEMYTEKQ